MMANMGYDDQHPPAQTPGAISERGQVTPWHEDYEFPASVGPPEEQQVDETYEQFEERVLNKRAGHMYHIVKSKLNRSDKLFLSEMVHRNNRKQTAEDGEIRAQILVRSSFEEEGSCCLRMSAKSQFIWDQGIVLEGRRGGWRLGLEVGHVEGEDK
uniref:Uncharacterized protein n=1 Tax=Timema genevievae TaxID=629358 RepID=A0A7R9JVU8_TIMGE|nr:unnamed protein product [Timema genevievae]